MKSVGKPAINLFANKALKTRRLSGEIVKDPRSNGFRACLQCGACSAVCPAMDVFNDHNPRKAVYLNRMSFNGFHRISNIDYSKCFQCYSCHSVCPQNLSPGNLMNLERDLNHNNHYDRSALSTRIFFIKYGQSIVPDTFRGAHRAWGNGWKQTTRRREYKKPYRRIIPQEALSDIRYALRPSNSISLFPSSKNSHQGEMSLKGIKSVAWFQSCCTDSHYPGVAASSQYLLTKLGIEINIIPEQSCCGGFAYYGNDISFNELVLINARNQAILRKHNQVVVGACATCYSTNIEIENLLQNEENKQQINGVLSSLDIQANGDFHLSHMQELLYDNIELLKQGKVMDFSNLKVAIHSGCHYRNFSPRYSGGIILSELVRSTGAQVVDYPLRERCCGGGFEKSFVGRKSKVRTLNSMKQESIMNAGVDMLVVDCPGCLMTFDRNSMEIKKALPELNISYIHIAEFLALALGAHPYETVGIQFHTAYRPILDIFSIQPPKNASKSVHLLKHYSSGSVVKYRK